MGGYTVGVLVQTNFGGLLTIDGVEPESRLMPTQSLPPEGSLPDP